MMESGFRCSAGHQTHWQGASKGGVQKRAWVDLRGRHLPRKVTLQDNQNAAPATKSDTPTSPNTAPATKSETVTELSCYKAVTELLLSFFFFCCIAELAIKPCRSSRSNCAENSGFQTLAKLETKTPQSNKTPPNPKHNTTQNRQVFGM